MSQAKGQAARRRAEEKASSTLMLMKPVVDLNTALNEHAIVSVTDPKGRVTFANQKFCTISGYSREELLGQDHRVVNSGYHPPEFFRDLWRTIRKGRIWHGDIRNRAKDGSFFWVAMTIVPFLDDEGKPWQYVSIDTDITERKRVETELAEKLRLEQLMVKLSARFVGILSERVDAAIEEIQGLIVESLGLDQSRLWQFAEGQPDLILTHQWRRPELARLPPRINSPERFPWVHEKILRGEAFYFASIDELPPDAARDVDTFRIHGPKSSIVIPVFTDGQVSGAIAFDAFASEKRWRVDEVAQLKLVAQMLGNVIARQQADERVQQLRREIAHSGRAAMLGELAAALAHELNQPLTAILSNAQAARRFISGGAVDLNEFRVILDDVVRDDKRAGAVIHNLRAMLNNEPVARESCRLNELVSDTADLLRGEMLAQKVELRLVLAPDLPPIDAGRVEIQQVVVNLVLNGVQAMKKIPPAQRTITIETRRESSGVSIGIRDRGPGIPPERLLTIFSPFYTTKTTGLGMGLAICRRLIEAHAGRIEAHNRDDGGAEVSFFLPFIGNRRRAPKPIRARAVKDNKDFAIDPAEKRTSGVSQRRGAIDR